MRGSGKKNRKREPEATGAMTHGYILSCLTDIAAPWRSAPRSLKDRGALPGAEAGIKGVFKPYSLRQNVRRTPNSLHSERGITVLLGARNPAGWANVDWLAILPLKSFP